MVCRCDVLFPRRSQEVAAEKLCSLAAERDDLQALLLATLQRLEGVEAVVAAADATSAAMEEKVGLLGRSCTWMHQNRVLHNGLHFDLC